MTNNLEKRIPKATPVLINWENHVFQQYQTKDALDRLISFYIARHTLANEVEEPLITYIQGSGPGSVFRKTEDGFWCGTNYDDYLHPLKNKAHFMVVEKPGVTLLDSYQGHGENWPQEFLFEHIRTLDGSHYLCSKSGTNTSRNKQEKIVDHWSFRRRASRNSCCIFRSQHYAFS